VKVAGAGAASLLPRLVVDQPRDAVTGTITVPVAVEPSVSEARVRLMRDGLRLTPDARAETLRQAQQRRAVELQETFTRHERRATPRAEPGTPPPPGTSVEAGLDLDPAGTRLRMRAASGGEDRSWAVEASTSPQESRLQVQFRATFGGAPAATRPEAEPSTAVSARTKEGLTAAARRLDEAREPDGRAPAEARLALVLTGARARGEDLMALATELEASEAWRALVRRGGHGGQTARGYVSRVVGE
jgi:hypothetical protein